jgi:flagellar basal-body rod protein FlgB
MRCEAPQTHRTAKSGKISAFRLQFAAFRQGFAAFPPCHRPNARFPPFGTPLAQTTAAIRQPMKATRMSESLFGIHGTALELRSQRMGLLTSNIANAATPGYKARDIDFAAALKARSSGASIDKAMDGATRYRVPVMPSLDGNTVEMATEQTAFAENAVGYSATLSFLKGRVETITRAIKGE